MYVDHQNIVFSRLSRQSTNTIMTGSWHGVAKFVIVKIMSKVGYQNRVLPDDTLTVFIWNCNFYFYSLCTYECRCHWFQSGWGTFEVLQHQLHHPDITINKHYMSNMRGQKIHFIHIHTGCSYLTSYCCEIAPHWVLGRMSRKCPRVTPIWLSWVTTCSRNPWHCHTLSRNPWHCHTLSRNPWHWWTTKLQEKEWYF